MNVVRMIPVIVSLLLLAAHFFREGSAVLSGIFMVLPFLLLFRERWVPWVIQAVLLLGAAEWLRTMYIFVQLRMTQGQPWTRLAIILGAVAAFTALSCLVFRHRTIRQRYAGIRDLADRQA